MIYSRRIIVCFVVLRIIHIHAQIPCCKNVKEYKNKKSENVCSFVWSPEIKYVVFVYIFTQHSQNTQSRWQWLLPLYVSEIINVISFYEGVTASADCASNITLLHKLYIPHDLCCTSQCPFHELVVTLFFLKGRRTNVFLSAQKLQKKLFCNFFLDLNATH